MCYDFAGRKYKKDEWLKLYLEDKLNQDRKGKR